MASNCMAVQDTSLEHRNHELGENVMGAIGNPVAEGGNCGDTTKSGVRGESFLVIPHSIKQFSTRTNGFLLMIGCQTKV